MNRDTLSAYFRAAGLFVVDLNPQTLIQSQVFRLSLRL